MAGPKQDQLCSEQVLDVTDLHFPYLNEWSDIRWIGIMIEVRSLQHLAQANVILHNNAVGTIIPLDIIKKSALCPFMQV